MCGSVLLFLFVNSILCPTFCGSVVSESVTPSTRTVVTLLLFCYEDEVLVDTESDFVPKFCPSFCIIICHCNSF